MCDMNYEIWHSLLSNYGPVIVQPWAPPIHGDDKKVPGILAIKPCRSIVYPTKLCSAMIDPIKLCHGILSVRFGISRELYFSPSGDLMKVYNTNKSNAALVTLNINWELLSWIKIKLVFRIGHKTPHKFFFSDLVNVCLDSI